MILEMNWMDEGIADTRGFETPLSSGLYLRRLCSFEALLSSSNIESVQQKWNFCGTFGRQSLSCGDHVRAGTFNPSVQVHDN